MARNKRQRNQLDDIYDSAEVVPSNPVSDKPKRRYRLTRRLVVVALLLAPFNALGMVAAVSLVLNGADNSSGAAVEISATQTGRTEAESSLQEWLDSDDTAFGGSTITSWDGTSGTENVEATQDDIGYQLMTHDFTIRTPDGVSYHAAVRTAYAPTRGVKVLSAPTITPVDPSAVSEWDPVEPTTGWTTTGASEAATSAITSWAGALTTSPSELKLATRDGDSSHVYGTLTGVTTSEVSVSAAWSPENDRGEVDESTLVATVSIELLDADAEEGDESSRTTVTYDVLVREADTAAPYVTAWGPVGSGMGLSDYENSVSLDGAVDSAPTGPSGGASDGGGESPAADTGDASTEGSE